MSAHRRRFRPRVQPSRRPTCAMCFRSGLALATRDAPPLGGNVRLCRGCTERARRRNWLTESPATGAAQSNAGANS